MLARTLGEKNEEKEKKVIANGILLTVISYIFIAILSIFGTEKFLKVFTEKKEYISFGKTYLSIITLFSFGSVFQILFEKILEAYGKTKQSMIIQISGSVINLILDPILIYGMFGIKALGVRGAAIATVIGQIMGMVIGIVFLINMKILPKIKYLYLDKETIKQIYKVGFPTIILESLSSFITIIVNKILIGFSDLAVAVWGIYVKVQQFIFIIIYGFNYGMIPIVAYNYGAKRNNRVRETIKFFIKMSITIAFIGMVAFLLIPETIIGIFGVEQSTMEIGVKAFRILSLGFSFASISMVLSATFQSLGNGIYSLIVNLSRKILFVLPMIFILKNILGITSIWISFVVGEIITSILAVYIFKTKFYNKLNDNIKEGKTSDN